MRKKLILIQILGFIFFEDGAYEKILLFLSRFQHHALHKMIRKGQRKILLFMTRVREAEMKALCSMPKFKTLMGFPQARILNFRYEIPRQCISLRDRSSLKVVLTGVAFACLHINYFGYLIHSIKGFVTLWERHFRKMVLGRV